MAKPETTFINWIRRQVKDTDIYIEKTCNPYRSGTPDLYLESPNSSLWVEVKFIPKEPVRSSIVGNDKLWELCTKLQKKWIRRAWNNYQPCIVLVGYPESFTYINSEQSINQHQNLLSRNDLLPILYQWL